MSVWLRGLCHDSNRETKKKSGHQGNIGLALPFEELLAHLDRVQASWKLGAPALIFPVMVRVCVCALTSAPGQTARAASQASAAVGPLLARYQPKPPPSAN